MAETLHELSNNPPDTQKPASSDVWDWVLWTFGPQRAHQVLGLPGERRLPAELVSTGYASGFKAAEIVEQLGVIPDCWASGAEGAGVHVDAVAVHAAVLALRPIHRGVLLEYGIRGVVPDWAEVPVQMLPVLGGDDKPLIIRDPISRRPIACAVEPTVDDRDIAWARRLYGYWHDALRALVPELRARKLVVSGPHAVARPWQIAVDTAKKN